MKEETGWLIEWTDDADSDGRSPLYFGKTSRGLGRTAENLDALRFARKEDAELFINGTNWWHADDRPVAVEHMWVAPKEAPPQ